MKGWKDYELDNNKNNWPPANGTDQLEEKTDRIEAQPAATLANNQPGHRGLQLAADAHQPPSDQHPGPTNRQPIGTR